MTTTTRDRTVRNVDGNPVVLFGVLDRALNQIVETFENRQDARDLANDLEFEQGSEFISIRLPVEYD